MKLTVQIPSNNYEIIIDENIALSLRKFIPPLSKTILVVDENLPEHLISDLTGLFSFDFVYRVPSGEGSKSFTEFIKLQTFLLDNSFDRSDIIVAFGGGVIGDLAGFAASTFLRGIRYINIPTTLLSQIDSSIGGKVAINHQGVKNVIGSFYHPHCVLINTAYIKELPLRQLNNGLVESIKAGLIGDKDLFELIETSVLNNCVLENLEKIIYKSIRVKKIYVERDEKEKNLRKILNFGHTIGHALESNGSLNTILHGESVGIGMLKMSIGKPYYTRLKNLLIAMNIDIEPSYEKDILLDIIIKDKKVYSNKITEIFVDSIGEGRMEDISFEQLKKYL